jgi:thioredoxin-like negative regulator of GroEL
MPNPAQIEAWIGRVLTPDELARVEERERRRREVHEAIDSGDLVEAKRLLDAIRAEWGDFDSEVVYAETSYDWARMGPLDE